MNYKKKYLKYKKKYLNAKKHGGSNQGLYNIAKRHLLDVSIPKILEYKTKIFGEEMYNIFIKHYLDDNLENIHDLNFLSDNLHSFIKEKLNKREDSILNGLSESFRNKNFKNPYYRGQTYYQFLTDLENLIGIRR